MHGKSIAEPVGADIVYSTRLGIYQFWQPGFLGALSDYLPGSIAVYAENKPLPISKNRTTTPNVILERSQSVAINGQHPLATMFLLLSLSLPNLTATPGAEGMASAQSRSTLGAGQIETAL